MENNTEIFLKFEFEKELFSRFKKINNFLVEYEDRLLKDHKIIILNYLTSINKRLLLGRKIEGHYRDCVWVKQNFKGSGPDTCDCISFDVFSHYNINKLMEMYYR
jgi:hypothetical protein